MNKEMLLKQKQENGAAAFMLVWVIFYMVRLNCYEHLQIGTLEISNS